MQNSAFNEYGHQRICGLPAWQWLFFLPLFFLLTGHRVSARGSELEISITRGTAEQVTVTWNRLGEGYGYGIQRSNALDTPDSWVLAEPVDVFPLSSTNWSQSAPGKSAFYRGMAVDRGRLLESSMVGHYSRAELNAMMQMAGIDETADYAVDVFTIVYQTFDHRGLSARASGAVAVPSDEVAGPLLSYHHGTIFKTNEAPSISESGERLVGVYFASQGYLVSMPDYLGLGGQSPPLHAYTHARSTAVASLDMLRAARSLIATDTAISAFENGNVFLAGYSQGGQATLALQREIEWHHPREFELKATAPMAGPYDMSGTMADLFISNEPYSTPSYLPYVLLGYNGVYRLFDDPGEVLASPYAATVPPLFDGAHSGSEIDSEMAPVPRDNLHPDFIEAFTEDDSHPLRAALEANDLYHWTPVTTTRLYHCSGDLTVPPANSDVAYSNFVANGSTSVGRYDASPGSNHNDGALPSFQAAKAWFDSL